MNKFIIKGLLFSASLSVSCQNNDLTSQLSGVYQVHHLQVFDELIDPSQGFIAEVKVTKTDDSHVMLSMDIRHQEEEPTPVGTLCTLLPANGKTQLIETKTNQLLGYIEATEIHLNSLDSKGSKTKIVGRL